MPLSKNAVIRYMVLDRCFSDRSTKYHVAELIDACRAELARVNGTWGTKGAEGVSRRQIYDDMNEMEMIYGVDIEHITIFSLRVVQGAALFIYTYRAAPCTKVALTKNFSNILVFKYLDICSKFTNFEPELSKNIRCLNIGERQREHQ